MTGRKLPGSLFILIALFLALGTVGLTLATTGTFSTYVRDCGVNVPAAGDMFGDYLQGCAWALALGLTVPFWPGLGQYRTKLVLLWAAKCFFSLIVALPYEQGYPGLDAYYYFSTSENFDVLRSFTGHQLGYEVIYALGKIHRLIGPGSYHAMKISFSFAGLAGLYIWQLAADLITPADKPVDLLTWFICLPSVLMWSSILGKDPVLLFACGLAVYGAVRFWRDGTATPFFVFVLGIAFTALIRPWLAIIILAPAAYLILKGKHSILVRSATLLLALGAAAFCAFMVIDTLALQQAGDLQKFSDMFGNKASSGLDVQLDYGDTSSVVAFMPYGMLVALFAPFPWQVRNAFSAVASVEATLLLILFIWVFVKSRRQIFSDKLSQFALGMIVLWAMFYSLLAFRDLGSAVRFRLQVLPVMVILLASHLGKHSAAHVYRSVRLRNYPEIQSVPDGALTD
jgi:hypothetical protein